MMLFEISYIDSEGYYMPVCCADALLTYFYIIIYEKCGVGYSEI